MWNKSEKHSTKFLDLTEALQDSGRIAEKNKIDLEVRNKTLNPESPHIIDEIMRKLNEWYGSAEAEEADEAWKSFKNSKHGDDEDINTFIQRMETFESDLRCCVGDLPNLLFALQFLDAINVDEAQKRNLLTNIKFNKENKSL